jgi:hypothetical protein
MECLITKVNYTPNVQSTIKINYNFKTSTVDNILSIVDLAIERGILDKSGGWFKFGDDKIQGKQGVRDYYVDHPDRFEELKAKVFDS